MASHGDAVASNHVSSPMTTSTNPPTLASPINMVTHKAILAKKVASYESQSNVNDRIKDACVSSSARAFIQAGSDCVATPNTQCFMNNVTNVSLDIGSPVKHNVVRQLTHAFLKDSGASTTKAGGSPHDISHDVEKGGVKPASRGCSSTSTVNRTLFADPQQLLHDGVTEKKGSVHGPISHWSNIPSGQYFESKNEAIESINQPFPMKNSRSRTLTGGVRAWDFVCKSSHSVCQYKARITENYNKEWGKIIYSVQV
jgi:hypothetical protein